MSGMLSDGIVEANLLSDLSENFIAIWETLVWITLQTLNHCAFLLPPSSLQWLFMWSL